MASAPGATPVFVREAPPPSWDGSKPGLMLCRLRRTFACGSLRQEWTGRNMVCLTGSARAAADSLEFEQLTRQMRAEHLEPFQGSRQSSPGILEVSRAICGASRARKQGIPHHLIRMEISFTFFRRRVSSSHMLLWARSCSGRPH